MKAQPVELLSKQLIDLAAEARQSETSSGAVADAEFDIVSILTL